MAERKDKLDAAIEVFQNEDLDLNLGERVCLLRDALLWNAFTMMQRAKKQGTKGKVSEEDEFKHMECMRLFKDIEKMYYSEIKMNKASGKASEASGSDFMQRIKKQKSSIGDIVVSTNI